MQQNKAHPENTGESSLNSNHSLPGETAMQEENKNNDSRTDGERLLISYLDKSEDKLLTLGILLEQAEGLANIVGKDTNSDGYLPDKFKYGQAVCAIETLIKLALDSYMDVSEVLSSISYEIKKETKRHEKPQTSF